MPHDVFISYSRSDGVQAGLIDAWLSQQGLRPFFDRRELGAGQLWLPDLERAIDHDAAAMIVLCGPQGLGNTQQYEAQLGLARKAREPDFPVIPVLLPGTPDWRWPRGFLSLQTWVSFAAAHDVREDPAALQRLLAAIRQEKAEADAVRGLVCPYKGLDAFQEEDAGLFFGRAEETEALHATIQAHRVAAILGRSGSGKSSLARAGLLPRLRRGAGDDGPREVWDSLVLRPGEEPLLALAGALSPMQEGEDDTARYLRLRRTAAELRQESADVLAGLLRHRRAQSRLQVDRLLILVDQGEELFARPLHLLRDAEAAKRFEADAEHFAALLLAAADTGIASVVLTLRSDFFDPLQSSAFGPRIKESLVPLRRVPDLRPCIEGPAEAVGLRFSPGLVDRVLSEVGTDETNLPLLQHALKRTWERREGPLLSSNAYVASGGVEQAIHQATEACFKGLSPAEQAAARRLFLRLVRPGEGRGFVRASAPVPQDLLERAVMDRFADPRQRLLFLDMREGRAVVEVAHEALIRGWPTLLAWVEDSREKLRARAEILRWRENFAGEPEPIPAGALLQRARDLVRDPGDVPVDDLRDYVSASVAVAETRATAERERLLRERQRTRLALGIFVGLFVLAVGVGAYAIVQRAEAERSATEAVQQREAAQASARRAEAEADRAEANAMLAEQRQVEAEAAAERAGQSAAAERAAAIEAVRHREVAHQAAEYATRNSIAAEQVVSGLIFDLLNQFKSRSGMPVTMTRQILASANRALDRLEVEAPNEPRLRRMREVALIEISRTLVTLGMFSDARQTIETATGIAKQLSNLYPNDTRIQSDLSRSYTELGDVMIRQNQTENALISFQNGLEIILRLATQEPDNNEWKMNLSISHERIGNALAQLGNLHSAQNSLESSLVIRQRLTEIDPHNAQWRSSLPLIRGAIAAIIERRGDFDRALEVRRSAIPDLEYLTGIDPENRMWQSHLAAVHMAIGNILTETSNLSSASESFRAAAAIRQNLYEQDMSDTQNQVDLANSYREIGRVFEKQGAFSEALAAFRTSLAINQRISESDATNITWRRELAVINSHIGSILFDQNDYPGSLTSYQASLYIWNQFNDLNDINLQRDLIIAYLQICRIFMAINETQLSQNHAETALHIIDGIYDRFPNARNMNEFDLAKSVLRRIRDARR
jgi:tetratricopeptide (TPR) repeat protein